MSNKNIQLTRLLTKEITTIPQAQFKDTNLTKQGNNNNESSKIPCNSKSASPAPTPKAISHPKQGQSSEKSGPVNLRADLRNIMHAFGDACEPTEASVDFMELILRLELGGFLYLCDSAISITGSNFIGLKEAIFVIRNEKNRLLRLFKYFAVKDHQLKLLRLNNGNNKSTYCKSYLLELRTIIESMDESGEMLQLLKMELGIDTLKTEKALRVDRLNLRATLPLYVAYAKARSVSFARKLTSMGVWIRTYLRAEHKLSPSFVEVMAFLTYEIVAHIVDLTFLIRREKFGCSNPITRLCDPRGSNPETCTSAPAFQLQKKRKDDGSNNVTEILVQASEMEAKRMKKGSEVCRDALSLTRDEIREAYLRLQTQSPCFPSQSYKKRAEQHKKFRR